MKEQQLRPLAVQLEWPIPDVAWIRLARGADLNTLTFEMIESLDLAIESARGASARVIIITGEGRAFCGGADIGYFTDPSSRLFDDADGIADSYVRGIVRVFRKLQDGPFVTIAAINGFAFGGGCELALSCDFRLISSDAKIGLTEAKLGAVPGAGGLQLLAKIIGRAKAMEVILLAGQLSAGQALQAGLVTSVHEADDLSAAALTLARQLCLCSPAAIAVAKAAIIACETATPDAADDIGVEAVRTVARGPEWKEGMAAFRERRPPSYAVREGKRP